MNDYYEILGIERNASTAQIKKAYFAMVRKYPPEGYPEKFMEIRAAYETLSNEETRREYNNLVNMPENVKTGLEYAQKLMERGNFKRAISLLESISNMYPDISVVENLLGEAYLNNNNTGKAVKVFEELVKKHPENAGFAGNLAHSYLNRGWHKKAIDAYKRAMELDKDNISLLLGLSKAYMDNDETGRAREILEEALRSNGKEEPGIQVAIYFNLFMIDVKRADLEGMNKGLEKLMLIAQDNEEEKNIIVWALVNMAQNMCEYEIFTPAKVILEAVAKLIPDDENLQELRRSVDNALGFDDEIEKLDGDERYIEGFTGFVESMVLPDEALGEDEFQLEFTRYAAEKDFLEKYIIYKKYINMLMEDYPAIYERLRDYFNRMESHRVRKKRIKECDSFIDKNSALIERVLDRMEMDDYLDDDEFEDSEYYEPQDPFVREEPKIGRNDPCPCGSGKKYKKCCGR